jgi:DNA-binding NarL/FixJ family response regulator
MAKRPTVLVALSDREHAEELAHLLARQGFAVTRQSDIERPADVSIVVTDGEMLDASAPHILLGDAAPDGNVRAVLPPLAAPGLVAAAVRLVSAGYRLVSEGPENSRHFEGDLGAPEHEPLTPRELETLALLADGASNKVIARELHISVHTAKFHVAAVLAKLGARNRADAVAIAMRQGLVYL